MPFPEFLKGVTKKTEETLLIVSKFPEVSRFLLVGGTALAIQLNHRLSEDIDLISYAPYPGAVNELRNQQVLIDKVKGAFPVCEVKTFDKKNLVLVANGVKIQFYADNMFHAPKEFSFHINNLRLPSVKDLAGMKLCTTLLRKVYRDYYDLFSIKRQGVVSARDFKESFLKIVSSRFVGGKHNKEKAFSRITEALGKEETFSQYYEDINYLGPVHSITSKEMAAEFSEFFNEKKIEVNKPQIIKKNKDKGMGM